MAVWSPGLAPRGFEVFNNFVRILLVEGARKSGKSIAIAHKLIRHAVENDGAVIGIFAISKSAGKVGAWNDLIARGAAIDQWREIGVEYAVEPKYEADSKMAYFRIKTPPTASKPKGGEAEFQLHSVNNENQVEGKVKGSRFSCIMVSEADNFTKASTIMALRSQLRSYLVPESRFQLILDSNPPEEGVDHWLYEMFFKNPDDKTGTVHFSIDDNIFFTAEQKKELYDTYKHDKSLLDRYYYGKWVKASAHGVFADVFLPNIHIVGEMPSYADPLNYAQRDSWPILRPDPEAKIFEEGWDIGDVNFGYVIGVPRWNPVHRVICYDILDELAYTNTRAGLEDIVDEVMDRRNYWAKWHREQNEFPNVRWSSWSDSSSLRHRISVNGTEAVELFRLSDKKINLSGVKKGSGSVGRRRDLLKRMLAEQRLYISPLCKNVLDMIRSIKSKNSFPIDPESKHKHIFDALTYMLGYGIPDNNERNDRTESTPKRYTISM